MTDRSRLVSRYRDFAKSTVGESDCFTQWALGVAEDTDVADWILTLPHPKQQPNLVFAAARWHGVEASGPYAGLRDALLGDDGSIRATIMARATQTNEVGRLATLMPVFALVAADEPIALLEVGPSAGLCLYPDRYDYDWSPVGKLIETDANRPRLSCAASGPVPIPTKPLRVNWRGGVDLNPLDVSDADAMRWLEILVWPEQDERRARLRAAVEVARREPPELIAGDLLVRLPDLVRRASPHGRVIVFHSAVIGYLERSDRVEFEAMMTSLVGNGACHWVSNEDPRVLPGVAATAGPRPATPDFLLGLDGEAVGWSHQHGASLTWGSARRQPTTGTASAL